MLLLYVSFAPGVAKKRQKALESAGLHVVMIAKPEAVLPACKKQRDRLLVIGHSVPPAEKNDAFIRQVKYLLKAKTT
jgi:hypothetical protein